MLLREKLVTVRSANAKLAIRNFIAYIWPDVVDEPLQSFRIRYVFKIANKANCRVGIAVCNLLARWRRVESVWNDGYVFSISEDLFVLFAAYCKRRKALLLNEFLSPPQDGHAFV